MSTPDQKMKEEGKKKRATKHYTMSSSQTPASRPLAVANAVPSAGSDVLCMKSLNPPIQPIPRLHSSVVQGIGHRVGADHITSVRGVVGWNEVIPKQAEWKRVIGHDPRDHSVPSDKVGEGSNFHRMRKNHGTPWMIVK